MPYLTGSLTVPKNLAPPFQQNGWAIKPSVRSDGESSHFICRWNPHGVFHAGGFRNFVPARNTAGSGAYRPARSGRHICSDDLPDGITGAKDIRFPISLPEESNGFHFAANGSAAEETVATVSGNGEESIAAVRQLQDHTEISLYPYAREAGFYKVSADSVSKVIALNADRRESQLECLSVNELKELGNDRLAVLEGSERFVADSVLRLRDGRQLGKFALF